jgi:hypothetical protein
MVISDKVLSIEYMIELLIDNCELLKLSKTVLNYMFHIMYSDGLKLRILDLGHLFCFPSCH